MLDEFKIGAYRGIKDLELRKLKKVNAFVGPNNCGKTSILEAIILSGLFNDAELLMDALISRYHKFAPELFESLFPISQDSVISLKSKINNDERILNTHLTYQKEQFISKDGNGESSDVFELRFDYSYGGDENPHDYFRIRFEDTSEGYRVGLGTAKDNKLDIRMPCRFISFSRFDRSSQFLKDLDEVLNQNLRQELIEILQIFDEQIINFEIIGAKRIIKLFRTGEEKHLTLYDYGNGMYKAFYIAMSALLARNGILLVDEVEAGIHNKALELFLSKLLYICDKNHIQLFFTTHSLEAIDILLKDCKKSLDDIAFYHIRYSHDHSVANRYSGEKLLNLRNEIGFDVR